MVPCAGAEGQPAPVGALPAAASARAGHWGLLQTPLYPRSVAKSRISTFLKARALMWESGKV